MVPGRGMSIRLDDVTEDSRCPSDVQCIQAGAAVLALTVESPGRTDTRSVSTRDSSSVVIADELELTLRALDPYPLSSRATQKSDYRARMVVLSRQTP